MTKNEVSAGKSYLPKQTICVFGTDGKEVGSTYPKRAAGLVKKGRACYMNDFAIRLNMSDPIHKSEVIKMDNMNIETGNKQEENKIFKLYFDARTWKFNRDCHNVGGRSFMEGPDKALAEAYMIGDWGSNWTEIISETLLLPKHTDCSFTFWLNGGENDRNDEVCRFEIIFNNDHERRYTYNLNRNYIRPLKKLNGWELYEIPFRTLDNEYTQMKFAAQRAYMTVMAAKDLSAYQEFADNPDPYEAERPQRHNLIFDNGFPKNSWYSTEALEKKHREAQQKEENASGTHIVLKGASRIQTDELEEKVDELMQVCREFEKFDADGFADGICSSLDQMLGMFRVDELADRFRSGLEEALSGREDEEMDEILERMADEVRDVLTDGTNEIRGAIEEFSNRMEELQDALEELSDQVEELKDSLLDE